MSGMTLLEVLFALAIVSILTMIAVPYYQDYRTRVKVAGELGLIEPAKKQLLEYYMSKGVWAANNAEALLDDAAAYKGNYLQSIEVSDQPQPGSLILTFDTVSLPVLGVNNTLVFYPITMGVGAVAWACDMGSMEAYFRPPNCR